MSAQDRTAPLSTGPFAEAMRYAEQQARRRAEGAPTDSVEGAQKGVRLRSLSFGQAYTTDQVRGLMNAFVLPPEAFVVERMPIREADKAYQPSGSSAPWPLRDGGGRTGDDVAREVHERKGYVTVNRLNPEWWVNSYGTPMHPDDPRAER